MVIGHWMGSTEKVFMFANLAINNEHLTNYWELTPQRQECLVYIFSYLEIEAIIAYWACVLVAVSHKYGYGLMDAAALVELAEKWTPVPEQRICTTQLMELDRYMFALSGKWNCVSCVI